MNTDCAMLWSYWLTLQDTHNTATTQRETPEGNRGHQADTMHRLEVSYEAKTVAFTRRGWLLQLDCVLTGSMCWGVDCVIVQSSSVRKQRCKSAQCGETHPSTTHALIRLLYFWPHSRKLHQRHCCCHEFSQVSTGCVQHGVLPAPINTLKGVVPRVNHGEGAGLVLEVGGNLLGLWREGAGLERVARQGDGECVRDLLHRVCAGPRPRHA